MAYSVDRIIPVNVYLTASGLQYANFSSCFSFGTQDMLASAVVFDIDTYRDYSSLSEVAEDFDTTSAVYLQASRWFAVTPAPDQFSVWMWDDVNDSVSEVLAKARDAAWRYNMFFAKDVTDVQANAIAIADWCDAEESMAWATYSDAAVLDPADDTDIPSVMLNKGSRHWAQGYQSPENIATDPSAAYAMVAVAALFHKFRPTGTRTAITAEFQVPTGVPSYDLSTTATNALIAKNVVIFNKVELKGSETGSRVLNSKTTSSYGEFIDDVINIDVLKNYIQVDAFNWLANPTGGTKRALRSPRDYAGMLATVDATCKTFNTNGVLADEVYYTDPSTGQEVLAKYGYAILSEASDVQSLTAAQISAREYPDVQVIAVLARAAHKCTISLFTE